jgi:hypothetical protein
VTIEEIVGYIVGVKRVFDTLGIAAYDTLTEWCRCKDHEASRKKAYRVRTKIKIKRAQKTRAEWNIGLKASKKAKKDGADYGSGIVLTHQDDAAIVGNTAHAIGDTGQNIVTPGTAAKEKKKDGI